MSRTVHAITFHAKADDVLVFSDPQRFEFLTSSELGELRDRTRRCGALARTSNPALSEELPALGEEVGKASWALLGSPVTPNTCLHLQVKNLDTWRLVERIAWEAAWTPSANEYLINSRSFLRVTGDKSHDPLQAEGPIRVGLITAAPKGRNPIATEAAHTALRNSLASLWSFAHKVTEICGPGTLGALPRLPKECDLLHIAAHGTRGSAGSGKICLESNTGTEDYLSYADFAAAVSTRTKPRLIGLAMCDSSPLAIELARYFPRAHIVAFLEEATIEAIEGFFDLFYSALLGLDAKASAGAQRHVEDAFTLAIRSLYHQRSHEWFLPVLYGPSERRPFVDLDSEVTLAEIIRDVHAGSLKDAVVRVRGLLQAPNAHIARNAHELLQEIDGLRAYRANLGSIIGALGRARDIPDDYCTIRDTWLDADLSQQPTAGAVPAMNVAAAVIQPRRLKALYNALHARKSLLLGAVEHLTNDRDDEVGAITSAREKLECFRNAQPGWIAALERRVVEAKRGEIVAGLRGGAPVGDAAARLEKLAAILRPDAARAAWCRRLAADLGDVLDARMSELAREFEGPERVEPGRVTDTLRWLIDRSSFLNDLTGAGLVSVGAMKPRHKALESLFSSVRATAATIVRRGVEARALVSAPRAELLAQIRVLAAGAATFVLADTPVDVLRQVEQHAQGAGIVDLEVLSPRHLTLLANEAAPVRPCAALDDADHPYLLLHPFGVHADTTGEELTQRVEFDVSATGSHGLLDALGELRDRGRRLCLDIALLPCDDREGVARCMNTLIEALAGGRECSSPPPTLSPTDRVSWLVLAGRPAEAAGAALSLIRVDSFNPADVSGFERLRAAYLTAVHAAEYADSIEAFKAHARHAIALLGVLVGNQKGILRWIQRRDSTHRHYQDDRAQKEQIEPTLDALARLLARALQRRNEGSEGQATVEQLTHECAAELRGARALSIFPLKWPSIPYNAGYFGLREFGLLAELARLVQGAHENLATLDSDEYTTVVNATGMTTEHLCELITHTCELRMIRDSSSCAARYVELMRSLQFSATAHGAPRALERLVAGADADERFPVHAAIAREDTAAACQILAAHIALILGQIARDAIEDELRPRRSWPQKPIERALQRVVDLDEFVRSCDYRMGGSIPRRRDAIESVVESWALRIAHAEYGDEERDEILGEACRLARRIISVLTPAPPAVLSSVALLYTVRAISLRKKRSRLRDAYEQVEAAYKLDPSGMNVVPALLNIAREYAADLFAGGQRGTCQRILQGAILAGQHELHARPGDHLGIGPLIEQLDGDLRILTQPWRDDLIPAVRQKPDTEENP